MTDWTEDEIQTAFRRRILSQALCHNAGKSVDAKVVMRFRKAGIWGGDIGGEVTANLQEILECQTHPARLQLPAGPLVVVQEDGARGIVDVDEHFFSSKPGIRHAALNHFLSAESANECWVSPFVLSLLKQNAIALQSDDEKIWIQAALIITDAASHDFRINRAGLIQSAALEFQEYYAKYMDRVLLPRAQCFHSDRPPVWNPMEESEAIANRCEEWASFDILNESIDQYFSYCGYLPLSGSNSLGSLVAAWANRHDSKNVWQSVWGWAESCPSVLGQYHAAHVFLEHPEWIPAHEFSHLTDVVRRIISSSGPDSGAGTTSRWKLRAILLEHFQIHLETSTPALKGEIVATTACWIAEMVAVLFDGSDAQAASNCEWLEKEVLPQSWQLWTMGRSRMSSSRLRLANLYNPFLWSDSLLATAIRELPKFPECKERVAFQEFLMTSFTSAAWRGGLRVREAETAAYAFQVQVVESDLGIPDIPADNSNVEAARQFYLARRRIEEKGSLKEHLHDLEDMEDELSFFLTANLRSWNFDTFEVNAIVREVLNNDEWRKKVFSGLPVASLHNLLAFIVEWQLQQEEEWLVRTPQLLAIECESSQEENRRALLLWATCVSSLAADICSPLLRLLAGPHRAAIGDKLNNWAQSARLATRTSEPWLAARIRGFLGTIENCL